MPPNYSFRNLVQAALPGFAPSFLFTVFFRKIAWKWGVFKHVIGLQVPVIQGRWKGHILSSFDSHKRKHPVIVEFKQQLDSITSSYFDKNAVHHSLASEYFLFSGHSGGKIVFLYQNIPIKTENMDLKYHVGVMELYVDNDGKNIRGTYFNNPRERNTYGDIVMEFEDAKLLGRF